MSNAMPNQLTRVMTIGTKAVPVNITTIRSRTGKRNPISQNNDFPYFLANWVISLTVGKKE